MKKQCLKCNEVRQITRHHFLLPRRWGKSNKTVELCRPCHDNAEHVLWIAEHDDNGGQHQLREWQYLALHQTFMHEGLDKARDFALTISRSHRHERQVQTA